MYKVLLQLLPENVLLYNWIEHELPAIVGPFRFLEHVPIPVAPESNEIMHVNWFNTPFKERGPLPSLPDESLNVIDAEPFLLKLLNGSLDPASEDGIALIDQVGRNLLFFILLAQDHPRYNAVREVFERMDSASLCFDNLVRLAKHYANEGIACSENNQPSEALQNMLFSLVFYSGAHTLSPTTPGVQYEMGVLCYDMAERFSLPGSDDLEWENSLYNESRHYLQLALADPQLRDQSPGFYILGVCRAALGDKDGAISAFKLFIGSKAAERFVPFVEDAKMRLAELQG